MDNDWINHFRKNQPQGRPDGKGWLTVGEMAAEVGCDSQTMNRYVLKNIDHYEMANGTILTAAGQERRARFFRFKS